LGAVEQAAALR